MADRHSSGIFGLPQPLREWCSFCSGKDNLRANAADATGRLN
jgi:hypothetical protein